MTQPTSVEGHYSTGVLLDRLRTGFAALGKDLREISVDDLGLADEFHIGGRVASEHFLSQLSLTPHDHVLDIGCGIGGPARFTATRFGARVTGIDLTPEFIDTGMELTRWVGLKDRVSLHQGSALQMPFDESRFDAAYMLHVGMNITDKHTLFAQVARVLKPGALLGIYDVMRTGAGALQFPLPWANVTDISAVAEPAQYRSCLQANGFEVIGETSRRDFALEFFAEQKAKAEAAEKPHPLSLQIVMGPTAPEKIGNLVTAIKTNTLAPVELIARKPV